MNIILKLTLQQLRKEDPNATTEVGPPDPVSNLRPIRIKQKEGETETEKRLRELRMDTAQFNQEFWSSHNQKFISGDFENSVFRPFL